MRLGSQAVATKCLAFPNWPKHDLNRSTSTAPRTEKTVKRTKTSFFPVSQHPRFRVQRLKYLHMDRFSFVWQGISDKGSQTRERGRNPGGRNPAGRQAGRQTDRQADRQTDRQEPSHKRIALVGGPAGPYRPKTAFLQGGEIEREVYITPPKEAGVDPGSVWKLKKTIYGLQDASCA